MAPRYVISATTTITHRVVVEAPNIEAIDEYIAGGLSDGIDGALDSAGDFKVDVEDARANDKLDLTIDESGEVISG